MARTKYPNWELECKDKMGSDQGAMQEMKRLTYEIVSILRKQGVNAGVKPAARVEYAHQVRMARATNRISVMEWLCDRDNLKQLTRQDREIIAEKLRLDLSVEPARVPLTALTVEQLRALEPPKPEKEPCQILQPTPQFKPHFPPKVRWEKTKQ
jgi:hypothetical protein